MRSFFLKILVFIVPLLMLGISAELLLRMMPNDYAFKKKYLDKNAGSIEVLFLGSSHTFYGINPAYIDLKSFNAAHCSQSLYYDAGILNKYASRLTRLKYIVIPVDYYSLYASLEDADPGRIKYYNIYYGIHTSNDLADNSELFGNKLKRNLLFLYGYYVKRHSYITCAENGYCNTTPPNKNGLITTGNNDPLNNIGMSDTHFTTNFQVLKNIVEYARTKNITILFFTSPAYKTYVGNLNKAQLDRTINAVTELCKSYPKAHYYNFLSDEGLTRDDYWDANHLNTSGAEKFTRQINAIINSMEKQSTLAAP